MLRFGVDVGFSGGIVRVNPDGSLYDAHVMPLLKSGEIDWSTVHRLLGACSSGAIEHVHTMPRDSKKSAFRFGGCYQGLIACLAIAGTPFVAVDPRRWKNAVLTGTDKSKEAAIQFALKRFPDINLMPGRKRTPHDGIADAACIAEWVHSHQENSSGKKSARKRTARRLVP